VREQLLPGGDDQETEGPDQPATLFAREPEKAEAPPRKKGPLRKRPEPGEKPRTLGDEIDAVKGKKTARFLSSDLRVILESPPDALEQAAGQLNGDVVGLVTDGEVNQRILDLMVGKGIEYIAAREFKGIIKRPLSIRLIKIS
jgi:DNA primase